MPFYEDEYDMGHEAAKRTLRRMRGLPEDEPEGPKPKEHRRGLNPPRQHDAKKSGKNGLVGSVAGIRGKPVTKGLITDSEPHLMEKQKKKKGFFGMEEKGDHYDITTGEKLRDASGFKRKPKPWLEG